MGGCSPPRGVPLVFATGYGEVADLPRGQAAARLSLPNPPPQTRPPETRRRLVVPPTAP